MISQKTEDLVGPYELHDFFLYYVLRFGYMPSKIYRMALRAFAGEYEAEFIKKWLNVFYRRFFAQQFKRSCLPDGPKVGSVAVSPRGDLRMPSDASRNISDGRSGDDLKNNIIQGEYIMVCVATECGKVHANPCEMSVFRSRSLRPYAPLHRTRSESEFV